MGNNSVFCIGDRVMGLNVHISRDVSSTGTHIGFVIGINDTKIRVRWNKTGKVGYYLPSSLVVLKALAGR